jgi:hypothetical protein
VFDQGLTGRLLGARPGRGAGFAGVSVAPSSDALLPPRPPPRAALISLAPPPPQLSRLEGKPGTAERPLSDLGAVSFRSYWQRAVLDCLRENTKGDISIQVRGGGVGG